LTLLVLPSAPILTVGGAFFVHAKGENHVIILPIGSMYGIYANIWGILMVNVTIYIAYMDPMGYGPVLIWDVGQRCSVGLHVKTILSTETGS